MCEPPPRADAQAGHEQQRDRQPSGEGHGEDDQPGAEALGRRQDGDRGQHRSGARDEHHSEGQAEHERRPAADGPTVREPVEDLLQLVADPRDEQAQADPDDGHQGDPPQQALGNPEHRDQRGAQQGQEGERREQSGDDQVGPPAADLRGGRHRHRPGPRAGPAHHCGTSAVSEDAARIPGSTGRTHGDRAVTRPATKPIATRVSTGVVRRRAPCGLAQPAGSSVCTWRVRSSLRRARARTGPSACSTRRMRPSTCSSSSGDERVAAHRHPGTGARPRPQSHPSGAGIVLDEGIRRMVAAGMDPAPVLASCTEVAARSLNRSDIGRIAPGALATSCGGTPTGSRGRVGSAARRSRSPTRAGRARRR